MSAFVILALDWWRIGSVPLHPLLVNFTAGLVPVSIVCDLLYRCTRRDSLGAAAYWTLLIAAAVTPLTVAAGWGWLWSMESFFDSRMVVHRWFGTGFAAALVGLALWRVRAFRRGKEPSIVYLLVALMLLGVLAVQGHIGAQMSFGQGAGQPSVTTPPVGGPQTPGEWLPYIDVSKEH